MKSLRTSISAGLVLLLGTLAPASSAAEKPSDPDERFLKAAGIATDDKGLMDYLRKRCDADENLRQIDQTIAQFGAKAPQERDEAMKKVMALGVAAVPALRSALNHADPEVRRRAVLCFQQLGKGPEWELPVAAVRLLARRQPAGAADVLLRALPYVVDENAEEDAWFALDAIAKSDPKTRGVLRAALKDPFPVRRAAAACVLGHRGDDEQRAAVRKLLTDAESVVRLRAAQGLLAAEDADAVPVLVALLAEAPVYEAWQAEELLHWLARDEAPAATVGAGKAEACKACRVAWEKWWEDRKGKVDWAKVREDYRRPGLLLLNEQVARVGGDDEPISRTMRFRVWLCGCDGKPRWVLDNLTAETARPGCVMQLLPGGRILLDSGIYDLDGKELWQLPRGVAAPHSRSQRAYRALANEYIFAVDSDAPRNYVRVMEVHPAAGGAYDHILQMRDDRQSPLNRGRKRRATNGRIVCIVTAKNDKGQERDEAWDINAWTKEKLFAVPADEVPEEQKYREGWGPPWNYLRDGHRIIGGDRDWTGWVVEKDASDRVVWDAWCSARLTEKEVQQIGGKQNLCGSSLCLGLVRLGFDRPRAKDFDLRTYAPRYLKWLKGDDPPLRELAYERLSKRKLLAQLEPAIPELVELMTTSKDETAVNYASGLLEKLGPASLPHAAKLAKHPDRRVRKEAIALLGQSCPEVKAYVPVLADALKDKEPSVRQQAVYSLGIIGDQDERTLPLAIGALADSSRDVRSTTLGVLERAGTKARDAIPVLLKMLKEDKDEGIQNGLPNTLLMVGPKDDKAIAGVIERARDKKHKSRGFAIWALRLGGESEAAVSALKAMSSDQGEDSETRARAQRALEAMRKRSE